MKNQLDKKYYVLIVVALLLFTGIKYPSSYKNDDNVLTGLKPSHPRILVKNYKEFDELNQRITSDVFLKKSYKNLSERAAKIISSKTVIYSTNDDVFLKTSREVLDRSLTLAMMFRLTNDKKYLNRLWSELVSVSEFQDWGSKHFLATSELIYAFSISFDWLYGDWSDNQRTLLINAIKNKGLLPGKEYYEDISSGKPNWPKAEHNWNFVCNGAMVIGALAIGKEEPNLSGDIVNAALKSLPKAMKNFSPDGGWPEGPGYLALSLKYIVATIAALETSLDKDFGLSNYPGFKSSGYFLTALSGAHGITFNYGDASARVILSPELFWLANRFNQTVVNEYEKKWSKNNSALEMLWYNPMVKEENSMLANYFRSVEVASVRDSKDDNTPFVAFKAGKNGFNHSHLDLGSFVFDNKGERWVLDLGSDKYSLPGYFNSGPQVTAKRWNYYRVSTEGHNTLLFETKLGVNQDPRAKTMFSKWFTSKEKSFGILNLNDSFLQKDNSWSRGFMFVSKQYLLIQDEFNSNQAIDVVWQIHTPANITILEKQRQAELKLNGKTQMLRIISPQNAFFETVVPSAKFSRSDLPGDNTNTGINKLLISLKGCKECILTVVFDYGADTPEITIQKLQTWH